MKPLDAATFEQIVEEGIRNIPDKFLRKMENVAIVIEPEPTKEQRKSMGIRKGWTLFGLYEGISQAERGANYTLVLPDKITIFQRPIEEEADDMEDLRELVTTTVWHEIAHHFGMDEAEVRRAEAKRERRPRDSK